MHGTQDQLNRRAWFVLVCLLVLLLAACGGKKQVRSDNAPRYLIKDIEFEGLTRFDKDTLLQYIYMDETSWTAALGLSKEHYYSAGLAAEDRKRIAQLYQSYGYYQARVVGVRSVALNRDGTRVKVVITIDEGEPTTVRALRFDWPQGEIDADVIEASCGLQVGSPFEVAAMNESRDAMLTALQQRGYAFAKVDESARIDREERWAEVTFTLTSGPKCTIGTIRFEGLTTIPPDVLMPEIRFAPGRGYSPELMKRIEQAIYGLDVFRSVTAEPDGQPDAQGRLNLVVRVAEANHQQLKVGFGVGIEANRWDAHVLTRYIHDNIDGRLMRFTLDTKVGYAVLPYPWDVNEHGPLLELRPWFRKKGWLEPLLVWTIQPSFKLDVEEGYQLYSPSFRFGVSRWLFGFTQAEASYNAEFVDFFDQSPAFSNNKTLLGRDYMDPYFLSYLQFEYTLYFTDQVLDPKNGVIVSAQYDISGTWLGSFYDYMKVSPSFKAYWTVWSHLQLAFRAETGLMYYYGYKPGAPIAQKYYLGGSDTVRGWGLKRLSPRIEDCDGDSCDSIAVGGKTMVLANFELRFMLIKELYFVPFVDMGDVQESANTYVPGDWQFSTGGGLRYASPIGKFRLDFGYRLNGYDRFENDRRWAIHLSFGETF